MYATEQQAWAALVEYANKLGRNGQRLRHFDVLPPVTATQGYQLIVGIDNGPRSATESE